MNCRRFTDSIPGYLEDGLAPAERGRFEVHVAGCPSCTAYLSNYRQTIRLTREAFAEPDDEGWEREALSGLLRSVLEARKPPSPGCTPGRPS